MKQKRFVSLLTAACICLSAVPLSPAVLPAAALTACGDADAAASGTCGENVTWTLDEHGELTISGAGDMKDYVSGMGKNFESPFTGLDFITVTIEKGVTSIGSAAFAGCSKLNWVTIPDTVTMIGGNAFAGCEKLDAIMLPDSLTYIGKGAFLDCTRLLGVKIPDGVTTIMSGAFSGCTAMEQIIIPESVTSIGRSENGQQVFTVFDGCDKLTIEGAEGSAAEEYAKEFNIPFEAVEPPKTSGSCGENVTWSLENGVLTISGTGDMEDYFAAVRNPPYIGLSYDTAVIEDGVTGIGAAAFYTSKMQSISIPDSVTKIEGNAFACCPNLKSLVFPDGITSLENGLCMGCGCLSEVSIPASVTVIRDAAFEECTSLTNIVIPDSVTTIMVDAFRECTSLQSITIPESVKEIGVSSNGTVSNAFEGCSQLTIKGVIGSAAEAYAKQYEIPFEEIAAQQQPTSGSCGENVAWSLENGILTISGTGEMTDYGTVKSPFLNLDFDTVIIEKGVTTIGQMTFMNHPGLKSITIPDGVTKIGIQSLMNCEKLTSVTLPDSVAIIDYCAFCNCTGLTEITIPKNAAGFQPSEFFGCPNLTIKGYADSYAETFAKENNIPFIALHSEEEPNTCGGLRYEIKEDEVWIVGYTDDLPAVLEIPAEIEGKPVTGFSQFALSKCDVLKEVTLPDTVTSFGMQTFWGCKNLEKVTLPSGLKSIYEAAFAECTALKSVEIPDGCETIGNLVFSGCTALSEITIPASVTQFFEPAFEKTPWLDAKRAENPLVIVNGILIDAQTAKGEVTVPEGVTAVNPWSVMQNDAITKLTLPKSLAALDSVYCCAALTEITFLNPDCEIPDEPASVCNGRDDDFNPYFNGTIRGYTGSTAEAFAKNSGYKFESLGDAPSAAISGDCDGDGALTVADAVLLARFVSEDAALTDAEISGILNANTDLNGDGLVTLADVAAILRELKSV